MATDIYGIDRPTKPTAVFSNENSKLVFGSISGEAVKGLMIQQWTIQYAQQVSELFELGSSAIYWQRGRPQGSGGIGRVVALNTGNPASMFPKEALNICDGGAFVTLIARAGGCTSNSVNSNALVELRLKMDGVVVNNIGLDSSVQETAIRENTQFRFSSLAVGN